MSNVGNSQEINAFPMTKINDTMEILIENMPPELQISMWIHMNTNSLKASYYILYNSPESSLPPNPVIYGDLS